MRIVLWIGKEANQRALANKIHSFSPLAGIVVEARNTKVKISPSKVAVKLIEKVFLRPIAKAWFGMLNFYERKYPTYPDAPILEVENINSEEVYHFTSKLEPDLVVVSGTRMIKKKLLSINPPIGIVNLHTGLSPYIKGGPNCTNWCIATRQFHLVGNTVMWINEGIDTGNIFATELTAFKEEKTLGDVHLKVMEHAHDLYTRCIQKLMEGKRTSIPQDEIGQGQTYYSRQWGLKQKINLVRNFRDFKKAIHTPWYDDRRKYVQVIGI